MPGNSPPLATLEQALAAFSLSEPELLAATPIARVWRVQQSNGERAVLKLYRHADRGNEQAGTALLRAWQDRGAVQILHDQGAALVMEHLEGPLVGDLSRAGQDAKATEVLARTARGLHQSATPPVAGLLPLAEVFQALFDLRRDPTCPEPLWKDIQHAQGLARHLLETQTEHCALHGDLHHDNVILTPNGPRVIDAKGYVGDPAFELANALRNPKGVPDLVRDPARIRFCVNRFADAMSVTPERLTKWAAAKCALSIAWRSGGTVTLDGEADLLSLFLAEQAQ